MSPQKKVTKATRKAQQQKLQRPTKKEKPVLKTPSILKIKIPLQNLSSVETDFQNNVDNANEDINESSKKAKPIEKDTVLPGKKAVKKNVTRKKTVLSKKTGKKVLNKQTTTKNGAPVTKKGRRKVKPNAPSDDTATETNGFNKEENTKFDVPELNKNFLKIMMANEVVKEQFAKKPKIVEEIPIEPVSQTKKKYVRKKQTLNKKQVLENNAISSTTVTTNDVPVNTVGTRKRRERKKPLSCCIHSTDEVELKPNLTITGESKDNHIETNSDKQTVPRKRKLSLNRKVAKAGPKLRSNYNSVLKESICNNEKPINRDTEMVETNKEFKSFYKYSQTDRGSMANSDQSCSSSNASLVTVQSKDFYLFDNKVPVLQLNNIDTDLKSYQKHLGHDFDSSDNRSMYERVGSENVFRKCAVNKGNNANEPFGTYASLTHENTLSGISSTSSDQTIPVANFNKLQISPHSNTQRRLDSDNKFEDCDMNKENNINDIGVQCSSLKLSSSSSSRSSSSSSSCSTCSSNSDRSTTSISVSNNDNLLPKIAYKRSEIIGDKFSTNITSSNNISTHCSPSTINSVPKCNSNTVETKISISTNNYDKVNADIKKGLEKLISNIKALNINAKWPQNINGDTMSINMKTASNANEVQDTIFSNNILQYETELRRLCLNLSRLVSSKLADPKMHDVTTSHAACSQGNQITNDVHINRNDVHINRNDEVSVQINDNIQQYHSQTLAVAANDKVDSAPVDKLNENEISSEQFNSTFFENNDDDDDDALSLFAESISGYDSCRKSNMNSGNEMSEIEEYIPQPLTKPASQPSAEINYEPTKILKEPTEDKDRKCAIVCEKQNADSTSPFNESSYKNALQEKALFYEDRLGNVPENSFVMPKTDSKNIVSDGPRLMALTYKPLDFTKSVVFKGFCFFNLISCCKKRTCKFPHKHLNANHVKNTLSTMSEQLFIQEYMLLRTWPKLRRVYGKYFVEECIRRDLTRIAIEMAIDCIDNTNNNSAEDRALKVEIVDATLLYLSSVDLSTCDDLLRYNVKSADGAFLCDFFMSVIATTQNFSRFKTIFVNLTVFMYQIGRKFSLDVAESILERLCILPYDQMLARAMLVIMENTDVTLFANSKVEEFEKVLLVSNTCVYEKVKSLKEQALVQQPVLANCYPLSPVVTKNADVTNTSSEHTDSNVRYSPDTTDLDNVNKTPIETKFTRTINFNNFNIGGVANSKSQAFKFQTKPRNKPFNKWMNRSIFDNLQNLNSRMGAPKRLPPRPLFKRRSDQHFGGSPSKLQRNSGPR